MTGWSKWTRVCRCGDGLTIVLGTVGQYCDCRYSAQLLGHLSDTSVVGTRPGALDYHCGKDSFVVFIVVTPCRLVGGNQRLALMYCVCSGSKVPD
jgi:hypothetical protein